MASMSQITPPQSTATPEKTQSKAGYVCVAACWTLNAFAWGSVAVTAPHNTTEILDS